MGVVLVSRRREGEGKMGERRIYLASMDHFFQKTGKKSDLSLALGFSLLLSRISNHPPRGGREEIGVEGIGGRGKRIEVEGEEIKVEIGIGGRGEEIEVARIGRGGEGGEEIEVTGIGGRGEEIGVEGRNRKRKKNRSKRSEKRRRNRSSRNRRNRRKRKKNRRSRSRKKRRRNRSNRSNRNRN